VTLLELIERQVEGRVAARPRRLYAGQVPLPLDGPVCCGCGKAGPGLKVYAIGRVCRTCQERALEGEG